MPPIRVLLADDHALVRAGICRLLNDLDGIEIVGQASNGREAIALTSQLQPDVLLMDISMPVMNGLEATIQVVQELPQVRVIILSMHASEEYAWQALQAGASGYLLKNTTPAELKLAIKTVMDGTSFLTSSLSKQVVETYLQRLGNSASNN